MFGSHKSIKKKKSVKKNYFFIFGFTIKKNIKENQT